MKQGTTYPIVIPIPGVDLTDADWIIVSLKPDRKSPIEFARENMLVAYADNTTTLTVTLTQAQSVALNPGGMTIDVNWMMDGIRGGCEPQWVEITETLLKRVVTVNG